MPSKLADPEKQKGRRHIDNFRAVGFDLLLSANIATHHIPVSMLLPLALFLLLFSASSGSTNVRHDDGSPAHSQASGKVEHRVKKTATMKSPLRLGLQHDARPGDEDTAPPPEPVTPELSKEDDGKPELSEHFLRRLSAQQVASQRAHLHRGGNLLSARAPVDFEEALRVTVPYD